MQKGSVHFDRDCIESVDQFEEYCHLNNIIFCSMIMGYIYMYFSHLNLFQQFYSFQSFLDIFILLDTIIN